MMAEILDLDLDVDEEMDEEIGEEMEDERLTFVVLGSGFFEAFGFEELVALGFRGFYGLHLVFCGVKGFWRLRHAKN